MSLVLQVTQQSLSADGTTMVFADTTGNYNSVTNPTGYGAPNAARNTLALFLNVTNNRYNGSQDIQAIPLTVAAYTPTTVSAWSVTMAQQGWIQATTYGVVLNDVTGATLYAVGQFVYDVATSQLRQILTVTGTGPYTYTFSVQQPSALGTAGTTVAYSTVYNTYELYSLNNCFNEANSIQLLSQKASDMATFQQIWSFQIAIVNAFSQLEWANAEAMVEQVENTCNCLSETSSNCGCN
jgi:hypothetical protein